MPELPDIVVYIEALNKRIIGHTLDGVRLGSPFLLRTAVPTISAVEGKTVSELKRLGKRICIGLEGDLWLVFHLMIAGRLHWKAKSTPERDAAQSPKKARLPPKRDLAAFEFDSGTLSLTEAGTQRRASLHLFEGQNNLRLLDRGGVELFPGSEGDRLGEFIDLRAFVLVLQSENHTLKRALTDPRLFSGIGNAYSDEILWQARLSPVKLTQRLTDEELERLHDATSKTLTFWVELLREEAGDRFPEKVTAFREGMAVHGRYKQICPRCGAKIQRIRYATNETNYCPRCQTGNKLLADRALSRILRDDWPKTAEELE
ncbi:MAG TPA: DNA-formamidopyrimidine glycosylase family protein [Pyrinomonadaceae bacterium]|nr:DNA-formamidopyrimidine glycosylase family protein [Pyrinomonadaceae bacterium]